MDSLLKEVHVAVLKSVFAILFNAPIVGVSIKGTIDPIAVELYRSGLRSLSSCKLML
ncbi:MAG: hypothetical protein NTV65_07925 [Proteobacteria bacterium]|nr:hypothetical protein [Pseudomonadota bacterium]